MISSQEHLAVSLPARGLISGQRVGVASGTLAAGPALLTVSSAGGARHTAVEVIPLTDIPQQTLAIGEDLFDYLGLGDDVPWSISYRPIAEASRLVLELATEANPEIIKAQIASAGLAGSLLWVAGDGRDLFLDVADVPYRVREIDTRNNRDVIARIGPGTVVELFAPGVKAGVDIVILADCSGSMSTDDIPVPRESFLSLRRQGDMPRMEALQQALRDLLDVRLQVSGRVSRIAMLGFNTITTPRFPRQGGMAQLDGDSPPEVIAQFREAIALLRPAGGTSIGNALHSAADLIYQHGRPGNDRLVILVSDGADNWRPRGEQGTGEVMEATTEPVSLMAHLHRDMNIRLHAIGISTRELFLRKYRDAAAQTPNHELLEELVKVGGGDPTAIGGLEVLVDYFSGVGSGVTHRVRGPLSAPPRQDLDPAARDLLRGAGRRQDAGQLNQQLEELGAAQRTAESHISRVFETQIFDRFTFGRVTGSLRGNLTPETIAVVLRKSLKSLTPIPGPAAQQPSVQAWASLIRTLVTMVSADPPDLAGVVTMCRATGDSPGEIAAAVVRRLTLALGEIVAETGRLSDYRSAPAGASSSVPGAGAGRGSATDVSDLSEAQPDTGEIVPAGFVYKT